MNEQFFQGHFPGAPIMPGVLQIEALAQAAGILGIETMELAGTGKLVIFMGIENAKFRAPVTPGCLLDLNVEFTQKRSRVYKFKGVASVEGKTTCEVEFTAMMTDAI
jgi:3-hydroxyacyl-[acyl-carrier-protein] dehydratase